MTITLTQFDAIDEAYEALLKLGAFETCADPHEWLDLAGDLNEALVEALGKVEVNKYSTVLACAADVIHRALTDLDYVIDVAADDDDDYLPLIDPVGYDLWKMGADR